MQAATNLRARQKPDRDGHNVMGLSHTITWRTSSKPAFNQSHMNVRSRSKARGGKRRKGKRRKKEDRPDKLIPQMAINMCAELDLTEQMQCRDWLRMLGHIPYPITTYLAL